MLAEITPVLLTYNEEDNIGRTLRQLQWAKDVVVVDSGSTDATLAILSKFPNVRVFQNRFVTHARQWRFATDQTGIKTEWILRLDADYNLTDALISELTHVMPKEEISAYQISFDYAVYDTILLSSMYPPNTILLRRGRFLIADRGHTEIWKVDGVIASLKAKIVHDDRKAVQDWLLSQFRYMTRESTRLHTALGGGLKGWLRQRPPLMPIVVLFYCMICKGLIFGGRAGVFYTIQRVVAESILSLILLESRFREGSSRDGISDGRSTRDGQ